MPTYQTTPMGKWKFPDQAFRMNQKGYGYAGVGHTKTRPVPEMGPAAFYAEHERQSALDRLKNNKSKMLGMLGVKDTTERSQRYKNGASLSMSKQNGVFPNDEYNYPPGGLRGGMNRVCATGGFEMGGGAMVGGTQKFFYFEEGQKWLENWKQRRINELNAIQKDDFSAGPPQRIQVAPAYNDLDSILAKVLDQFEAGAFSNALVDDMNKLQGAFLKMGDSITSQKLAQYMRVVGDIQRQAQRITADPEEYVAQLDRGDDAAEVAEEAAAPRRGRPAIGNPRYSKGGEFALDTKDLKVIKAIGLIAKRMVRLLEEINKFVNDSPDVRKRAMEEIGSRVLGAISSQQSAFGSESTQPRMTGDITRRPTEERLTRGFVSERESRIPPVRPPAELEAPPAGTPPVKPF